MEFEDDDLIAVIINSFASGNMFVSFIESNIPFRRLYTNRRRPSPWNTFLAAALVASIFIVLMFASRYKLSILYLSCQLLADSIMLREAKG